MPKRVISLRSASFWLLGGIGLGLLLLVGGWSYLQAEGEEARQKIRLAQAEWDKLEPGYREVLDFKARKESLVSLLAANGLRSRLFEVSEAVVTASEPNVVLERLDVSGLEVRVVAQAEDSQSVQSFIESLRGNEIFSDVELSKAETAVPRRFEVRCKWLASESGGEK